MPQRPKSEPRVKEAVYMLESIALRVRRVVSGSVRFSSLSQFYSVAAENLLRQVEQQERQRGQR